MYFGQVLLKVIFNSTFFYKKKRRELKEGLYIDLIYLISLKGIWYTLKGLGINDQKRISHISLEQFNNEMKITKEIRIPYEGV